MSRKISITKTIQSAIEKRRKALESGIAEVKEDELYLSSKPTKRFTFRVKLTSLWADHGEKSVSVARKLPLSQVVALAVEEFKKVNGRSDVQAGWTVSVVFPSGREVSLPKEYWGSLER